LESQKLPSKQRVDENLRGAGSVGTGKGSDPRIGPGPSSEASGTRYAVCALLAIGIHAGVFFGGFGDLPFEPAEYGIVRGDTAVEVALIAAPPVLENEPVEPAESDEPGESLEPIDEAGEEQVPASPLPEAEQEIPKPEPTPEAKMQKARTAAAPSRTVTASPKPKTAPIARKDGSPAGRDSGTDSSSTNATSGSLTSKPAYLHNPHPPYPESSRKAGHTGVVILRVSVGVSGRVAAVSLIKSSGYSLLDDRARTTVRSWIFRPARRGGRPVATQVDVPVRFSLDR
jgi:protein TonB